MNTIRTKKRTEENSKRERIRKSREKREEARNMKALLNEVISLIYGLTLS